MKIQAKNNVCSYCSDRLGKVPLWGDAPETVINDFQQKFKLSVNELEILFGAYREDNPNCKLSVS